MPAFPSSRLRLASLVASSILVACSHAPPTQATSPNPVRVTINSSVEVSGTPLTIRFVSVQDSRCPTSVQCVWAGDGAVVLLIADATRSATDTLHTTLEPKAGTFGAYRITLVSLEPYPTAGPPPPTYLVTLRVEALPD
ncbi:MAG: hypothetical protein ABJD07_07970 [Gemmatimonadaceae bacterium]